MLPELSICQLLMESKSIGICHSTDEISGEERFTILDWKLCFRAVGVFEHYAIVLGQQIVSFVSKGAHFCSAIGLPENCQQRSDYIVSEQLEANHLFAI